MYNGAIYIRSSKYNEERENTLAMQQSIVNTYLESKPDIVVRDVYVDNGYSGLDFLRPGFSKMIRDIEQAYSYGDDCDKICWFKLLEVLKKSLEGK